MFGQYQLGDNDKQRKKKERTPRSMSATPRKVPICLHSGSSAYSFWMTGSRHVCCEEGHKTGVSLQETPRDGARREGERAHLGRDGRLEGERRAQLAEEAPRADDERGSSHVLALAEERARRDDAREAADEALRRGAGRVAEDEGAAHRVAWWSEFRSARAHKHKRERERAHHRGKGGRWERGTACARGSGQCRQTARATT